MYVIEGWNNNPYGMKKIFLGEKTKANILVKDD